MAYSGALYPKEVVNCADTCQKRMYNSRIDIVVGLNINYQNSIHAEFQKIQPKCASKIFIAD